MAQTPLRSERPPAYDVTERLLRTLPLPLAQIVRRSVNGKSSVERHNNAYYLAEVALKLAAAARIGLYVDKCLEPGSPLARSLEALFLPSAGHWLSFLRDIDAALAKRPDASLLPLGETLGKLGRRQDWAAVTALAKAASEESLVSADAARAASKDGLLGFFGFAVAYRNEVMGHGAQRRSAFYEKFGALWIRALSEVLEATELFGALRLAHAHLRAVDDAGAAAPAWRDLTGCAGYPLKNPPAAALALPAGRLYFVGPGVAIPLHPVAVYLEDEAGHEAVGILNRTARRTRRDANGPVEEIRRVDYLDYATGENLRGLDAREALTTLLGKLRGRSVSPEEAAVVQNLTAQASPDDVDEVISSGASLGDFELLQEVGRGGMGIVYRARQRSLNRVVALKVLPPGLASDPTAVDRFRREVTALARCDHPNVVKVVTSGVDGDRHYYAMEYVEGTDLGRAAKLLSEWRSSGATLSEGHLDVAAASVRHIPAAIEPMSEGSIALATGEKVPAPVLERKGGYYKRLALLFAGAASGLHHLHEKGILHRDIKPGNLMLTADGARVVVMDLGLARLADESRGLTKSDVKVLGTLRYMPPEQLVRKLAQLDGTADVYSLGATLYELVAGRPMLDGEDEAQLVQQILSAEPTPAERVDKAVPRALSNIITVATAKDKAKRYSTARAFAEDLEAFYDDRPIKASPPGVAARLVRGVRKSRGLLGAVAALGAVGLIAGIGWWWWSRERVRYCANATTRWGVMSCIGEVSSSTQKKRSATFRFVEKKGRTIRVERVNGSGSLVGDEEHDDVARWEYTYRDDGKVHQGTLTTQTGKLVRREVHSDGLHRIDFRDNNDQPWKQKDTDVSALLVTLDASGYVTERFFANVYGARRANQKKIFGQRFERDASGGVATITSLSSEGKPIPSTDGFVKLVFARDKLGNAVSETRHIDGDAPGLGRDGFARRVSTFDEAGNETSRAYFDSLGPTLTSFGYARRESSFDGQGNETRRAFFGVSGKPAASRDGYASWTSTYHATGYPKERAYLDEKEKPTADNTGASIMTLAYDARGNIAEVAYFGPARKPTLSNSGCARLSQAWTSAGLLLESRCFGVNAELKLNREGLAVLSNTYDGRGNLVEQTQTDPTGALVLGKVGCARIVRRRDDRGNESEKLCFGGEGTNLVLGLNGWARIVTTFDDHGNQTEIRYFGPDGRPVIAENGSAFLKLGYDSRGNRTHFFAFGLDGEPAIVDAAYSRLESVFDHRGNKVGLFAYGPDGKPTIANKWGTHGFRNSYDEQGRIVQQTPLDVERKPALSTTGYQHERITYVNRPWGVEKQSMFYDANNGATVLNNGVVAELAYLIPETRRVSRLQYDARGRPIFGEVDEISWLVQEGGLRVRNRSNKTITEPMKLKNAETTIAAWTHGLRMRLSREQDPAKFHGALGALVQEVPSKSIAERVGLRPGDIVVVAGDRKVDRPADVKMGLDLAPEGARALIVIREGTEIRLVVDGTHLGAELVPI